MRRTEEPDPARVVVDADVLVADVFVDGSAREALDLLRDHSWLTLVLTEQLIADAVSVIASLADSALAETWEAVIRSEAEIVQPRLSGHPALTAAAGGNAASVLSLDERLLTPTAGAAIRPRLPTSVKSPDAFVTTVDPASLYEALEGGEYTGSE